MDGDAQHFSGLGKLGRKSNHVSGTKRRGTPIPVAPPRVPTPMPPPGEVERKLAQQALKTQRRNLTQYHRRYEENQSPWINPRIIAKANPDLVPSYPVEDINDLHHALNNKNKEKIHSEKPEKKIQESKKRMRIKWFQNDNKREKPQQQSFKSENICNNSSVTDNGEKYVNQSIGERTTNVLDIAASLTCTTLESGSVIPASRSSDRFATKINNNYNFKYYGFLDSGDENTNDVNDENKSYGLNANNPIDLIPIKNEDFDNRFTENDQVPIKTFKTKKLTDMASNKEIVYENVKIGCDNNSRKIEDKEFKRLHHSDWAKSKFNNKNRSDGIRKQNYEHLSRKFSEYNVSLGKYEKKLSDFSIPESSFQDIYNAGVINGSAYGDYGGLHEDFSYLESKYTYSVSGIPGNLAQSSAAAAFFARASQKLNLSSPHRRKRHASTEDDPDKSNGFAGTIHRTPPAMPPALLRRIGVKEVTGVGKVKVMLRVTGNPANTEGSQSFFNIDSRKKQVTLFDPAVCGVPTAPEDRRVGVAAPKMFAFDAIFSQDDSQAEICSTALTEVIHAVINGTDGCLFCFGHAKLGKSTTMLGTPESSNTLGIIPCAISWLFRGIHEQKQRTGARFSVRVSAVEVCQPSQTLKDLLAGHANDCEQSPGVYLRDDPLFGTQLQNQSELRVPNAEKAAFYLDAAVNSRSGKEEGRDSHFLYTLHVYQYSVAGKGGVAGGRSRLHLIDLGSCDRGKASGGIPLSGLGNVLLAIFNGQKHLPYREHKITQLLKECLSSLTCHAAMIAHVSQSPQHYTDTLTTVQLASRIHRMRRRKFKFGGPSSPAVVSTGNSSDELARQNASTGSSDVDPSSSEQSADTVIYVGPADDAATDGEHPPVYIPSLNSGDNRCAMGKALRGSGAEIRPGTKIKHSSPAKSLTSHKTTEEKASGSPLHKCNKSGISSSKSSPVRTINNRVAMKSNLDSQGNKAVSSNSVQASRHEEQWIDGPRISKQKVAEARNILLKEHIKKETWIDGPMQKPVKPMSSIQGNCNYGFMDSHKKSMIRKWVENQTVQLKQNFVSTTPPPRVESSSGVQRSSEPTKDDYKELTTFKTCNDYEEVSERQVEGSVDSPKHEKMFEEAPKPNVTVSMAVVKQTNVCLKELKKEEQDVAGAVCNESSESSEEERLPPPPLPLILRYGKEIKLGGQIQPINRINIHDGMIDEYDDDEDEIELEIVEVTDLEEPVPTQDSCLQVTEEDIAFCMGEGENPLPEVDQESHEEHPLRILSQENLTVVSTFTDSMSVANDFERCLPRPRYGPPSLFDHPFHPNGPYYHDDYIELLTKHQNLETEPLDQLARLHQIYKSKLGMVNNDQNSKPSARCQSLSLSDVFENHVTDCNEFVNGSCSIYSEPPYRLSGEADPICNSCKKNISKTEESDRVLRVQNFCDNYSLGSRKNLSSLRHPDGASNPNLDEMEKKEKAPAANNTSKSDYEEENKEKSTPTKKKLSNSEHRKGGGSSPSRKPNHQSSKSIHETTKQNEKTNEIIKNNDLVKLNESNLKLNSSPTRNANSPSRGELRRTNSASTNKSKRIEESEDKTKCATPPPTTASPSPLTQKHLYFNKTCPSNEGSDSGHESNVSPKIAKLTGRPRPQVQCESSGYESVVSFTSSLDSEVGVKLIREDPEELHDPGGQSVGDQLQCKAAGGALNAIRWHRGDLLLRLRRRQHVQKTERSTMNDKGRK